VDVNDSPEADWYLQDWAAFRDKRQADLVSDLGWLKNHAHRIWHGKQPYRRDIVNQVAAWLGAAPYELLLPPEEAMRIRLMREAAGAWHAPQAAEKARPWQGPPALKSQI
jgi:hypothetical protein